MKTIFQNIFQGFSRLVWLSCPMLLATIPGATSLAWLCLNRLCHLLSFVWQIWNLCRLFEQNHIQLCLSFRDDVIKLCLEFSAYMDSWRKRWKGIWRNSSSRKWTRSSSSKWSWSDLIYQKLLSPWTVWRHTRIVFKMILSSTSPILFLKSLLALRSY